MILTFRDITKLEVLLGFLGFVILQSLSNSLKNKENLSKTYTFMMSRKLEIIGNLRKALGKHRFWESEM